MNIRKKLIWSAMFATATVALTGCIGGSSSGGSSSVPEKTKQGVFNNVTGLSYKTTSGINGVLGKDSVFNYREGDQIEFYKDDIIFGEVKAEKNISVYSFSNEIIVIQVLTAKDVDGDSNNGYQI